MRWLAVGFVAIMVAAVVVGTLARPSASTVQAGTGLGKLAPDFTLFTATGSKLGLSHLRGKPVLINFWATWCTPCRSEMPLISKTLAQHAGRFSVVAVDKQEPRSDVLAFARQLKLKYMPVIDPAGSVFEMYRAAHLQPVSYWLDAKGIVRAVQYGPMTPGVIADDLRKVGVT